MSNNFKLIMENWNQYVSNINNVDNTIFVLKEGKYQEDNFDILLEKLDSGLMTESQLVEMLEASIDYEWSLLEEQFLGKLAGKARDFLNKATEKINDFVLKYSLKLMNLAQRSITAAVKGLSKLTGPLKRLMKSHPGWAKVGAGLVAVTVMTMILAAAGGDAQAAVAGFNPGEVMTQNEINAMKGLVGDMQEVLRGMGVDKFDALEITVSAIEEIEKAAQAQEVIDLSKVEGMKGKVLRVSLEELGDLKRVIQDPNTPKEDLVDALEKVERAIKQGAATKVSRT